MDQSHLQTPPAPLWTAEITPPVITSLVVSGEALFVAAQAAGRGAQHSKLLMLDAQSGAVQWQHNFEYALISGLQPYYLQDSQQPITIVTTCSSDLLRGQGQVLAFDLMGEIIWKWQSEEKNYSAPAAQEMQLLVLVGDSTLAIISPEAEGNSVTRVSLPASTSLAAPAVQDNMIYIPCRGPETVAVDLDGTVHWHFRAPGSPHSWLDHTPVLHEASLFTASREGTIFALNAISGQLIWQEAIGDGRAISRPAAANGQLFVGTRHGLTALDSRNGQVRWTYNSHRPVSATPLVSGDTVYVAGQDHRLMALDAETGVVRWFYEVARRIELAPIVADGKLIMVDRGGAIVALPVPDAPESPENDAAALATLLGSKRKRATAWEKEGHLLLAAQLWQESGELEKAAQAYQGAELWLEAADLWQQMGRYGKRAEALEEQARQLAEQAVDDERKAVAWVKAARAHAEIGQVEARRRCEREAARYRRQPILSVNIEQGPMQFNSWSKVDFTIRNDGYGAARGVLVKVVDDRFEGQAVHTQTMVTLPPNRSYQHWLDVLPKAQGSDVPMQLAIEYMDINGSEHRLERTFYLPVMGEDLKATPVNNSTGSEEFATLQAPDGRDLVALRRNIVASFSKDELEEILFDLGLRGDDFDQRVSTMARQLITYAVQSRRLDELVTLCRELRPHVEW